MFNYIGPAICVYTGYEYAGFRFQVQYEHETHRIIDCRACLGQHRSAYKEKHRQNAMSSFRHDLRNGWDPWTQEQPGT